MAKKQTESGGESLEAALAAENARVLSVKEKLPESQEIPPSTLSALEGMTTARLIEIVRACNAQAVNVLALSEEQQAQLVLDTLLLTAITAGDRKEARESAKLWLDRKIGPMVTKSAMLLGVAGEGGKTFADILSALDGKTVGLPGIE